MRARHSLTLLVAVLGGLLVGCNRPDAEFVFRDETNDLVREARDNVESAVEEAFGTPDDLAAWLKMPIDFGQVDATLIADRPIKPSATSLKFLVSTTDAEAIEQAGNDIIGCGLLWTSGAAGGTGVKVAAVEVEPLPATEEAESDEDDDEEDSEPQSLLRIELAAAIGETVPAAGDSCTVVGFRLRAGRRYYQRHCQHCHGTSGDGNGPTAQYLNPWPRDYRRGVFKFTNLKDQIGASAGDLHRLIKQGIPGTYMPSFMLLPDNEVEDIAQYVRFLAMRGQYELGLTNELLDFTNEAWSDMETEDKDALLEEFFGAEAIFPETMNDTGDLVAEIWANAEMEESVIVPPVARVPDSEESRVAGRKLFLDVKTKCVACHGVTGLGNGPQTTSKQIDANGKERAVAGLFDVWNKPIKPRNLTRGIYRGGRRPYDLYCRIAYGIKGTPMAGFASSLKPEEIWHLVNYVMSIPHDMIIPGRDIITKHVASAHGESEDHAPAEHAEPEHAEPATTGDSGE